jgi:nucleoside-diphosphate-sugar epimerase
MRSVLLLTGASGFIGRRCLELLSKHHDVLAITRGHLPASRGRVRWASVNLLDPAAVRKIIELEKPSLLLHAAWRPLVSGDVAATSPDNLNWMSATLGLTQAFREAGGKRAAIIGSCAEYDWSCGLCKSGITPHAPTSLYGSIKHALRIALEAYAVEVGLELVWPRPFFVYGPGDNPTRLVPAVIDALLEGRVVETSHGNQMRDYLHVDDVAAGIVAALESSHSGPIDICSGEATSLKDIIREIERQLGREDLIRLGARATSVDEVPLVVGDPLAIKKIGWLPRFKLGEGLANTIANARSQREVRRTKSA